jgi:chemotaxis protein MotB
LTSVDRNAVRQILEREGCRARTSSPCRQSRRPAVVPDDPSLAANRSVTITLMREDPPLPPDLKP